MHPVLPLDPMRRMHFAVRFGRRLVGPKAGATQRWRWRGPLGFQLDATRSVNPARVSWALAFGEEPRGAVRRTCGSADCIRPDHLVSTGVVVDAVRMLRAQALAQRQVGALIGRSQPRVSMLERWHAA